MFVSKADVKNLLQVAVAVKKILYAADPKQSALEEAQLYLQQFMNLGEDDSDDKAWYPPELGKNTWLAIVWSPLHVAKGRILWDFVSLAFVWA